MFACLLVCFPPLFFFLCVFFSLCLLCFSWPAGARASNAFADVGGPCNATFLLCVPKPRRARAPPLCCDCGMRTAFLLPSPLVLHAPTWLFQGLPPPCLCCEKGCQACVCGGHWGGTCGGRADGAVHPHPSFPCVPGTTPHHHKAYDPGPRSESTLTLACPSCL